MAHSVFSTPALPLFSHLPKLTIQAVPQDRKRLVVQTAEENYMVSCIIAALLHTKISTCQSVLMLLLVFWGFFSYFNCGKIN